MKGGGLTGWWRKFSVNPWFVVVAAAYAAAGHGREMAVAFLAVVLHELGHAIVAESYGLTVDKLEIWPFGGIARISGLTSQDPYVEAMVAVVGPLHNFALAAVAWLSLGVIPVQPAWVHDFVNANLVIGLVNLLPAAPLDGGRLARLYWASRVGYDAAGQRVERIGRALAWGLWVLTVLSFVVGRPTAALGLFGGFLYWGSARAGGEAPYLIIRDLAVRAAKFGERPIWPVEDLAVREDTRLGRVLQVMRPMKYHRVVVLDTACHRLGTLYEEELLDALTLHGPTILVGQLVRAR